MLFVLFNKYITELFVKERERERERERTQRHNRHTDTTHSQQRWTHTQQITNTLVTRSQTDGKKERSEEFKFDLTLGKLKKKTLYNKCSYICFYIYIIHISI